MEERNQTLRALQQDADTLKTKCQQQENEVLFGTDSFSPWLLAYFFVELSSVQTFWLGMFSPSIEHLVKSKSMPNFVSFELYSNEESLSLISFR